MYLTFREGPLPRIMCPEAIQWVLEVLEVPMCLTNGVLVGSQSPNLAVHLHICLKSEILIVFGLLKAAVDSLLKETIELTIGTLREGESLAPIYWEFVLPRLDKGVLVDRIGMAYVPDDLMIRHPWIVCWTWMPSPRQTQSPRLLSQSPRRGLPAIPLVSMQVAVPNTKQHLRKGLDHPVMRPRRRMVMRNRHNRRVNSWSRHTKEIQVHCLSRKDSHRHQRD